MAEFVVDRYRLVSDEQRTAIYVEYRGTGLWAVTNGGRSCFNKFDEWEDEPLPSNRDAEFFERCRYPFHVAKERAEVAAKAL